MTTNRTQEHVEQMMRATLDSLAICTRAIRAGKDVPDDEHGLVPRGEGANGCTYLRELVIEQATPKHSRCTDLVFTLGGPKIWLRSITRTNDFMLMGMSAGLDAPITWPIDPVAMPEVHAACNMLMSYDFMDLGQDPEPATEFAQHDPADDVFVNDQG